MVEQFWRYIPLVLAVLQVLGLWALWSMRKAFVSTKACEDCRKVIGDKLSELTQDAAVADARRDGLATAREVAEVKTAVVEVREQIKALAEVLKRVEQPVRLLMDYHLERDPK